MPHLYVVPGHGAGDPGACGNGFEEAERVRALAARIKELGGDGVTLAPFDVNFYAAKAYLTLDIPKDWQIVELHMDSAGSGARGAHVIYQGEYTPDQYDVALADGIAAIFPGRANKLVGRTELRNPNQATKVRGFAYRLVENGFISDACDVATFNARMNDIARLYLDVFGIPCAEAPVLEQPAEDVCQDVSSRTRGQLEVDGYWGVNTTKALQAYFHTPQDGEVWGQYSPTCKHYAHTSGWVFDGTFKGSLIVKAIQARLGVERDGLMGPRSRAALMDFYDVQTYAEAVAAMQAALNMGRF